MTTISPFERDIAGQPTALRELADAHPLRSISSPDLSKFDRIILTGMGSSHYAALPTWRRLVANGYSAWWLSTGELLDSPQLVTDDSLLWITSQSGRSGEIVALLESLRDRRPKCTLGVTNDLESPLSTLSDVVVDLHSGVESTVSTKSYMNTLAVHHLLLAEMMSGDNQEADRIVIKAADELESWVAPTDAISSIAKSALETAPPRIVLIGAGDEAATALLGGLIFKEAAKLNAEGYIGGEFRHGPLELAGPGLTALLYMGPGGSPSLEHLSAELRESGSITVELGGNSSGRPYVDESSNALSRMMIETKFTQCMSVELARTQGLIPGEFLFGQKVTSTL